MGAVKNTIVIFIVTGLLAIFVNYLYANLAFDIKLNTDYYLNPETNKTIIHLSFYNNGYKTIDELNFIFGNDCNLQWYAPKLQRNSEDCKLKESLYLAGTCSKLDFGSGLDLIAKYDSSNLAKNCNVTMSYDVKWPGLFFRLSSTNYLKESAKPIYYGDEPPKVIVIELPRINFSYAIKPIKNFAYNSGRILVLLSVLSNKTQEYIITGEWFNSSTDFDSSTLIRNFSIEKSVNIEERRPWNYYYWAYFNLPDNANTIGFMVTIRGHDNSFYQKNTSFEIIKRPDLIPFLSEDDNIKFDNNSTGFALDNVIISNAINESSQAETLLQIVRNYLIIPKEINKKVFYDEHDVDSNTTFYAKEGTFSEFNSLYIMFLRSLGIPAKMEFTNIGGVKYPYTSVYINSTGWIAVDVYNINHKFGECFINCTKKADITLG